MDMSRVSISRSYAVLVGLEAYVKTRKKIKHGVEHVADAENKILHPEEHKKKEEAAKDKSRSAEKERQILAENAEKAQAVRKEQSWKRKLWKKIRSGSVSPKDESRHKEKHKGVISKPGLDVESGIPPNGKRDKLDPS